LRLRFPSLEASRARAVGYIDDVNGTGRPYFDVAVAPRAIPRGATIYVSGWMVVPGLEGGAGDVVVTVDGAFAALATAGYDRPDIARMYGPAGASSGFDAVLPSAALAEGDRTIGVVTVVDEDRYVLGPQRRIRIARSALRTTIDTPVVAGVHVQVDTLADCDGEGPVRVAGWAADLANAQPCAGVCAIVDDVHVFPGRYGAERPDVAAALGHPQLRHTGYEIRFDAGALGAGDHLIRVVALSADGAGRSHPSLPLGMTIRPR
jgi:hypothetical protein